MCSAINLHILKYKIDKTMNKTIRLGLIYKLIYNHCNEFCIGLTIDTFRYEMTFFRHKLIFSTITLPYFETNPREDPVKPPEISVKAGLTHIIT